MFGFEWDGQDKFDLGELMIGEYVLALIVLIGEDVVTLVVLIGVGVVVGDWFSNFISRSGESPEKIPPGSVIR